MSEPAALAPLDDGDFHATLAGLAGPVLVCFTRPGCAACRHWERLLGELQARHPEYAVRRVDVERNMALAREFEVFHLPALHLFVDGEYHAEIQCEARLPALLEALDAARRAEAQEAP